MLHMLRLLCLLLAAVAGNTWDVLPRDGYTCDANALDAHQWCLCKPGQKIGSMSSKHNNHNEDRIWTLKCEQITPEFIVEDQSNWYFTTSPNGWDAELWWQGTPDNSFLVGMTSEHSNHYEDRQFKFFTTKSDNWYLTDCIWHNDVNGWDGPLDYVMGDDEVFGGLHSIHSNHYEDRQWDLQVCKLRKKCTEIIGIEYDTIVADVTTQEVFGGHGEFDNTHGTSMNTLTVTINHSTSQSLTETYSYSQSSGWEHEEHMDISEGFKFGFPMIEEATLEVTVGFSNKWNFEETWTRSSSMEYTEANGHQMTFTSNCAAGCNCKMDVLVTTASGVIPYHMTSQSVDGKYTCEEDGELTVDYSFNGRAAENDICN